MANNYHNTADPDDFSRLGHPGKLTKAIRYTAGQIDLTGSNYG